MNTPNLSQLSVRVTIGAGSKPIKPGEILYIKACGKHCLICFIDLTFLETNHLLQWYEEKFPLSCFCRCHDSFMVNFFYIECISGNSFLMQKGQYIPISYKKKKASIESYEEFIRRNNFH